VNAAGERVGGIGGAEERIDHADWGRDIGWLGSSKPHPSTERTTGPRVYHFFPFRGKVTTPDGRPVANAAIIETLLRPSTRTCAQTLVGYRTSADGTFVDDNALCPGIFRVSASKDGYVGRPTVLTLRYGRRPPLVHLVVQRR
jgi:hypothetical protein